MPLSVRPAQGAALPLRSAAGGGLTGPSRAWRSIWSVFARERNERNVDRGLERGNGLDIPLPAQEEHLAQFCHDSVVGPHAA